MRFLKELKIELPHAGQEATVRTEHEKTDWFQIMKEIKLGLDNVTLLI